MTESKTAAIVLAAGKGTRMKTDRPKVLHEIAGRAMIDYVLEAVRAVAPERAVVVIAPAMEAVRQAVAPLSCAVQDPQLGTGHAVLAAAQALEGFAGDVLILFADTPLITPQTLERLLAARRAAPGPAIVVLGMRPEDPREYGRLITDSSGALEAIVEFKDAGPEEKGVTLCNAGVMAVDGKLLFELLRRVGNDNAKGEYYLTDIVAIARGRGLACAVVEAPADELLGVNSRADLAVAEALVQLGLRAAAMANGATLIDPSSVYFSFDTRLGRDVAIGPNVVIGPGVTIGDGAEIRAFSHLEGASIAAGATIGPFARLRPGAEIAEGASIGNFVEIKKTRVEAGAKINHLSYIGDARIGAGANIGAGTITCNYDGFEKFHTDIGEGAFIGSNTALIAPVSVGKGAVVAAGSTVTHDVADDSLAIARAEQTNKKGWADRFRARKRPTKAAPGARAASRAKKG